MQTKVNMNLIQIESLSYSYSNTKALENINLEIKSDDFLAIIGPNGGGKSTLFKLILELLHSGLLSELNSAQFCRLKSIDGISHQHLKTILLHPVGPNLPLLIL